MAQRSSAASTQGYRLRVPATSLWFDIDVAQWHLIRAGLSAQGAESVVGGLEGEELCSVPGLLVSYRADARRMQSELTPEGGSAAVRALAALRQAAPPSAADATPIWLWAEESFTWDGIQAEPAIRVMRSARWILPIAQAPDAFTAGERAYALMGERATLSLRIQHQVEFELGTAPAIDDDRPVQPRIQAFALLLTRLGSPTWAEYSTHPSV